MDNSELGILISGGIDVTKTVTQINSDLKALTKQVSNLSLNIDTSKMVKDIESQMGKVRQVTEKSLNIDSSAFTKEGNKFISSIKELEKQHNGMTQSVVKNTGVVENKYGQLEEQLKNYLVTVKTADNEIKKIRLSPQTDAITGKTTLQTTDIQTINNSKQVRQEYINWWDKAVSQQRRKEVAAQEKANQKLIDDNYKMIVKRREDEEKLANQIGAFREQSMSRRVRDEEKLAKIQAQYANKAVENTKKQVAEEKKKTDELDRYIKKQQDLARRQTQELRASRGDVLTSEQNKQLDDYVRGMNNITTNTPEARRQIDSLKTGFKDIQSDAKVASQNVNTFASNLTEAFRRIPVWMIGMSAFYAPLRGLNSAIDNVIMLDTQMTSLRRVMDATPQTYNNLMQNSIALSTELGNRVQDVNDSMVEFARQGYDPNTLIDLTGTATVASNISSLSTTEAMSSLTASMYAFNIEASNSISIIDKLNEVDNNFAIDTKTISDAIERSAASANTFGVDLDNLIGHISAIGITTRESGSVIGNSLKSIYSRITTMQPAIDALADIGINVRDSSGDMRDVSDIIDQLSGQWNHLSAEQQQNMGVTLAGKKFAS